ncbi:MAG: ABC transporter substrate-binding protein [Dehalococcoidia bacterium]
MEQNSNYWLRRKLSRRTALRGSAFAGVGAASLALVGCGDDDDDDDTSPTATTAAGGSPTAGASPTTAVKQPKPGGAFSFQMPAIPPSLDPYTQTSYQNAYVNGLSYSKLVRFAAGVPEVAPADNTMEPDLAEKLPEQPDELKYIFKIKKNAKWQDVAPTNGRALTSKDVLYAFDRYLNFEKSVHKTGLAFTDKIEAPDDNTVVITTKAPYADTISYLGGNLGAWISPKEHAESPEAATKMVGSGPFTMTELQTGVSIKWKKNASYFDSPYPYFDDLTAFGVSDLQKRVADFSSKQVDLTWLFLPDPRDQVKKNRPDAKFEETQGIGGYIYLRTDKPPFNNKLVRQAISMALDRKAIRDAISGGEGVPDQLYFVGYPFARQPKDLPQGKYWEYNLAEAKKMMSAAGVGEINTTWSHADVTAYGQEYLDTATLAQAQLKEIGINITDNIQPYANYISTTYQGNYEGMGHSPRAVSYFLDFITERFTMKPKRGRINLSYVTDPALEDLMDKQRSQLKLEERLQTVKQIEELVAEEQYEIYFSTDTRSYFWNPDIQNYRPTAWFPYTHLMKTWRDA